MGPGRGRRGRESPSIPYDDARLAKPDWEQRLGGEVGGRSDPHLSCQGGWSSRRFGCGQSRAVLSKLLLYVRPKEGVHFVKGLILKRLQAPAGLAQWIERRTAD